MWKNLLLPFLVASLVACGVGPLSTTLPVAPAPLAQTKIDEVALNTAWRSFDAAVDAITLLRERGILVPGTPRAVTIASAIRKVTAALNAAQSFAAAGNSTSYKVALAEAGQGISTIREALRSN